MYIHLSQERKKLKKKERQKEKNGEKKKEENKVSQAKKFILKTM